MSAVDKFVQILADNPRKGDGIYSSVPPVHRAGSFHASGETRWFHPADRVDLQPG